MMQLNHDHLTRQLDLLPIEKLGMPVNIIGCGAIGSFVALELAKMGVTRLKVWDNDEVSVENMSNQFFRFSDIGKPKAHALASLVNDFTRVNINAVNALFTPESMTGLQGIVIAAVDSMAARRMILESAKSTTNAVKYIIDPRMSAEFYTQYTTRVNDSDWYVKSLHSDKDAVQERCTAKSTIYTATLAAGMVVKTVKNILMSQEYPKNVQWNVAASTNSMLMFGSVQ